MQGYKDENIYIDRLSDLTKEEASEIIGKTIVKISAHEYSLELEFNDGSSLKVSGARWDDCCLGVSYYTKNEK